MKAIVLCAGYGTRLGGLTRELPKPMLELGGEPLLAHTLALLRSCGFDQVGINLHHHGETIRAHFGDGARFGLRLHYVTEPELRGTAGALLGFVDWLADADEFAVLYGDLLLDQDLALLVETHRKARADATLLLHRRRGSNSFVELDSGGRVRAFVERPDPAQRRELGEAWVNSGVQVLSHALLELIPGGRASDLPRDVYAPLVDSLHLQGVPLSGYRCAIDSPERYQEGQRALEEARCRRFPSGATR